MNKVPLAPPLINLFGYISHNDISVCILFYSEDPDSIVLSSIFTPFCSRITDSCHFMERWRVWRDITCRGRESTLPAFEMMFHATISRQYLLSILAYQSVYSSLWFSEYRKSSARECPPMLYLRTPVYTAISPDDFHQR